MQLVHSAYIRNGKAVKQLQAIPQIGFQKQKLKAC